MLKDKLHSRAMIGAKISVHDFSSDEGNMSIGDDLAGRDDKSLKISSDSTGLRSSRNVPTCCLSDPSGSKFRPESWFAMTDLTD